MRTIKGYSRRIWMRYELPRWCRDWFQPRIGWVRYFWRGLVARFEVQR